ncbi:hypothetical protein AB1Y20_003369 [Prymnesium parvum]|uniref:EF-hand domain-containing protein n=1 Tax=Prymnesium parvum TaxID=97485 RepID=A0AB34JBD5_PRYPA|mmetsp:Transcript_34835/g.86648  ORF Transcript_34835/g.86648 Transcript_34835/m.86648 type:complete len:247 (+) Transcript_34835:147-887(+)
MEKERRLNATLTKPVVDPEEDEVEDEDSQAKRIAALKEEKRKFYNTATEDAIREILNQPSAKPATEEKTGPKRGSLLEWAQNLEASGDIKSKVSAQVNEGHAAIGATGRLADLVAKDNDNLVKDFKIEDRLQHMDLGKGKAKASHTDRVVHNMEKVGLHRDPQRAGVQEQIRRAFAVFDKNSDGKITREEFRKAMMHPKGGNPVSQEKADALFKAADTNGNGYIDYDEFAIAFTRKSLRPPGWIDE